MIKLNFFKRCLICHDPTHKKYALCEDCEKLLPYANSTASTEIAFNTTVFLFDYVFPVDKLITRLKFQHQLANANLLGQLLSIKIKQVYHNNAKTLPSLLIPVPLHPKRLRERGFNQALEIAKPLSKILHVPIDIKHCYRTRYTLAQSELSRQDRLENLKQAFALYKPLSVSHIALIDDVMTTGETLRELAKCLRKSGVDKIDVWCCAKTAYDYDID